MALPTLDAAFASSADLPRRQMLAKWLVEELGETQAPSNVLVSGAGEGGANGLYVRDGEFSGKPKWTVSGSGNSIVWDSGESAWIVGTAGDFYFGYEDVAYPWLVQSFVGAAPFPVVTEVPAPSPLSNYYPLPERYLWAKIAVAAGGPRGEADYISLPKNYAWSDIYNAVAGSSGNHTDWSENVALGYIAAAYRGDTANPANLATYIDWPWRYKVASIILAL